MTWLEAVSDDVVAAVGCLAALGLCFLLPCATYHLRRRWAGSVEKSPVFRTAPDARAAGPL
jgi:hypothetical protein